MSDIIESRKTEVRYKTSDIRRMLGRFLVCNVLRTWTEDFVDEDTGKVHTVERNEVLFERGTYIDKDICAKINFYMQEGSISEVEVSNQKRVAFVQKNTSLFPYKAVARIGDKRCTYLLYATSAKNAITILTDYIELNSDRGFCINDIKELDYYVILIDSCKVRKEEETECEGQEAGGECSGKEFRFYQLKVRIASHSEEEGDSEQTGSFIVQTSSAFRANILIMGWLHEQQEKRYQESLKHPDSTFVRHEITSFIEESKIIPVGCFIPMEFSMVYQDESE